MDYLNKYHTPVTNHRSWKLTSQVYFCYRFSDLKAMCQQLEQERYWRSGDIKGREIEIMTRWQELLTLLEVHKDKLERYCTIITLQRELDTLASTIRYGIVMIIQVV